MGLDTRTDLVKVLEQTKNKTPLVLQIIAEAKAGEYHDYKNEKYDCGKVAANTILQAAAAEATYLPDKKRFIDEAANIRNGTYDEEADEDDKAAMREYCPPELRGVLGL